jgi:hypothetical protein
MVKRIPSEIIMGAVRRYRPREDGGASGFADELWKNCMKLQTAIVNRMKAFADTQAGSAGTGERTEAAKMRNGNRAGNCLASVEP